MVLGRWVVSLLFPVRGFLDVLEWVCVKDWATEELSSQTNPALTAGLEVQTESDGYTVQINKERGGDFEGI